MNVEQKREAIKQAYSSDTWKEKCNKMSDAQVTAIYLKFVNEKKI